MVVPHYVLLKAGRK